MDKFIVSENQSTLPASKRGLSYWWHTLSLVRGILLLTLMGLVSFCLLALFIRPIADDYCLISEAKQHGAFQATINAYQAWSGRYATYYLVGKLGATGIWTLNVLPIVLILGYVAALYWILVQVADTLGLKQPRLIALYPAVLFAFIWVNVVGVQAIFWISGSASYGIPALILLLHSGATYHVIRNRWTGRRLFAVMLGFCLGMLVAAGFSEIYVAMQAMLLSVSFVASLAILPPAYRLRALGVLGASLLGLAIGAWIVVSAPGNVVRIDTAQGLEGASAFEFLWIVFIYVLLFLFAAPFKVAGALTCLLGIVAFVVWWYRDEPAAFAKAAPSRHLALIGALSFLIAAGFVTVSLGLTIYAVTFLAPRTLLFPHLFQLVWMTVWAYLIALWFIRRGYWQRLKGRLSFRLVRYAIVFLLVSYPLVTIVRNIQTMSQLVTYAYDWDKRDAYVRAERASGQRSVSVAPLRYDAEDLFALEKPDAEPDGLNGCVAAYYGLDEFRVVAQ